MSTFMALFGLVWLLRLRGNLCTCRHCQLKYLMECDSSDESQDEGPPVLSERVSEENIETVIQRFKKDVTVQTDFDDDETTVVVELHNEQAIIDTEDTPTQKDLGNDKKANPTQNESLVFPHCSTYTPQDDAFESPRQTPSTIDCRDPLWETVDITLERGSDGLGFCISGGGAAGNVVITKLAPTGAAFRDGRLQLGDALLQVNDLSLESKTHAEAVEALQSAGSLLHLKIRRPLKAKTVTLNRGARSLGLGIAGGVDDLASCGSVFVSHIAPGGAAHVDGRLRLGDKILAVKNEKGEETTIEGATHAEAVHALRSAGDTVTLVVMPSAYMPLQRIHVPPTGDVFAFQKTQATSCSNLRRLVEGDEDVDDNREIQRCVRVVRLTRTGSRLGMDIIGGSGCVGEETGVFVSGVSVNGAARNILHVGDRILSVDGIDLTNATHQQAASALRYSGNTVSIMAQHSPEQYEKLRARIRQINAHPCSSPGGTSTFTHGTFPR